jgi:hypothetical protein
MWPSQQFGFDHSISQHLIFLELPNSRILEIFQILNHIFSPQLFPAPFFHRNFLNTAEGTCAKITASEDLCMRVTPAEGTFIQKTPAEGTCAKFTVVEDGFVGHKLKVLQLTMI